MDWIMAELVPPAALMGMAVLTGPVDFRGQLMNDDIMIEKSVAARTKELEASFLKIIGEHHAMIYKICRAYTNNNRTDQKDLYQEIVCKLWKAYPSYKGDTKIPTWIYTVALRAAILPFRRKRGWIEYRNVLPDQATQEPVIGELDDRMFLLFQHLEIIDRAVLVLVGDGFSSHEIGVILGLKLSSVTSRMTRLRKTVENFK